MGGPWLGRDIGVGFNGLVLQTRCSMKQLISAQKVCVAACIRLNATKEMSIPMALFWT